jgi:hypothetical protein
MLAQVQYDLTDAKLRTLFRDSLPPWKDLWSQLASAINYYIAHKKWEYRGEEADMIVKNKIPVPLIAPEEILAQDRALAEDCLERIACLEKSPYLSDYHFPDELIAGLGRFVLPERRELFPALEHIPKECLDNSLTIDEHQERSQTPTAPDSHRKHTDHL